MFARPDTGSTPISYPVPTSSAAKGIFEAVLRRPHVYVQPTRVEICRPIRFERYVTNYGGPLRKGKDIREKNSYQFFATILVEVCYRIHGEVRMKQMSTRGTGEAQLRRRRGQDWRPRFKDLFDEATGARSDLLHTMSGLEGVRTQLLWSVSRPGRPRSENQGRNNRRDPHSSHADFDVGPSTIQAVLC